jgi:hypothetical protein
MIVAVLRPRRRIEEHTIMGIGVGIILMAIGAVLSFAVTATANGIDINTIGIILMIAGGLGILLDLVIFAPRRRDVGTDRGAPVDEVVTRTRY